MLFKKLQITFCWLKTSKQLCHKIDNKPLITLNFDIYWTNACRTVVASNLTMHCNRMIFAIAVMAFMCATWIKPCLCVHCTTLTLNTVKFLKLKCSFSFAAVLMSDGGWRSRTEQRGWSERRRKTQDFANLWIMRMLAMSELKNLKKMQNEKGQSICISIFVN